LSNQSFSRIEEFGTGAGLCIIFDSIFNDIPMGRVKLDAKAEWEFVGNFKVLQACFDRHKVGKP
jgi:microtubule-associated protein, RP/EB family